MADNEQQGGNLLDATESLVEWVAVMVGTYGLSESTVMDLFRIQLMWVEQSAQRREMAQMKSGQDLVDDIAAEVAAREANEVIDGE